MQVQATDGYTLNDEEQSELHALLDGWDGPDDAGDYERTLLLRLGEIGASSTQLFLNAQGSIGIVQSMFMDADKQMIQLAQLLAKCEARIRSTWSPLGALDADYTDYEQLEKSHRKLYARAKEIHELLVSDSDKQSLQRLQLDNNAQAASVLADSILKKAKIEFDSNEQRKSKLEIEKAKLEQQWQKMKNDQIQYQKAELQARQPQQLERLRQEQQKRDDQKNKINNDIRAIEEELPEVEPTEENRAEVLESLQCVQEIREEHAKLLDQLGLKIKNFFLNEVKKSCMSFLELSGRKGKQQKESQVMQVFQSASDSKSSKGLVKLGNHSTIHMDLKGNAILMDILRDIYDLAKEKQQKQVQKEISKSTAIRAYKANMTSASYNTVIQQSGSQIQQQFLQSQSPVSQQLQFSFSNATATTQMMQTQVQLPSYGQHRQDCLKEYSKGMLEVCEIEMKEVAQKFVKHIEKQIDQAPSFALGDKELNSTKDIQAILDQFCRVGGIGAGAMFKKYQMFQISPDHDISAFSLVEIFCCALSIFKRVAIEEQKIVGDIFFNKEIKAEQERRNQEEKIQQNENSVFKPSSDQESNEVEQKPTNPAMKWAKKKVVDENENENVDEKEKDKQKHHHHKDKDKDKDKDKNKDNEKENGFQDEKDKQTTSDPAQPDLTQPNQLLGIIMLPTNLENQRTDILIRMMMNQMQQQLFEIAQMVKKKSPLALVPMLAFVNHSHKHLKIISPVMALITKKLQQNLITEVDTSVIEAQYQSFAAQQYLQQVQQTKFTSQQKSSIFKSSASPFASPFGAASSGTQVVGSRQGISMSRGINSLQQPSSSFQSTTITSPSSPLSSSNASSSQQQSIIISQDKQNVRNYVATPAGVKRTQLLPFVAKLPSLLFLLGEGIRRGYEAAEMMGVTETKDQSGYL
ncbi:MAG: hypothetical protein EZS28_028423, partial [Streblomastix strix]